MATSLPAQSTFDGKAQALGAQINTPYEELAPRLSPDDQRMYFVRGQHPNNMGGRATQDIWVSDRKIDGSWTKAKNIGAPLNNKLHNSVGAVGMRGDILLLSNVYKSPEPPFAPTPGISRSKMKNGQWSEPEMVMPVAVTGDAASYISFCADPELSALVLTIAKAEGEPEDLYVSFRTAAGKWTPPITLGDDINSRGFETTPFLSRDSKVLFFSSNGHGGEGDADIFMSRRLDETWQSWSTPINLGSAVNTPGFDAHFILDSDEKIAYFVSGETPTSLSDIYTISTEDIPAMSASAVAATMDTLRVTARGNGPVPISLDVFGITTDKAPLTSAKSLDGKGRIVIRSSEPVFVYRPETDFAGTELLEVTLCDPPHSDDCKRVIVLAEVQQKAASLPPKFITLRTRTPKNTPVKLDLGANSAAVVDISRSNQARPATLGSIAKNNETGGEHIFYRPGPDATGTDTMDIYMHCDKPRAADCMLARVIVDVYQDAVAVVEPDPVEPPVVPEPPVPDPVVPEPVVPEPVAEPEPPGDVLVTGVVTDEKSGSPLSADLTFFSQPTNQELGAIRSNPETGAYELRLPAGVQYTILVKEKYHFDASSQVAASARDQVVRDIALTPLPTDVGTVFRLDNIYFDTDKAILKPESKAELTRLYDFLKANPSVRIKINGHTDSQSPEDYNLTLSNNRARAVVNYLKYKGVMGHRLDSQGYGESEPVATNDTEEGRALNRRVEFVITKK